MKLMKILTDRHRNKQEIAAHDQMPARKTLQRIRKILKHPLSAVVSTDDCSSDDGPQINPLDIIQFR